MTVEHDGFALGNGDCLELMKDIPDASVDLILCDLPYGVTACPWDSVIPFEPLWAEYLRAAKRNAAIVLTASQPFTSALVMSNPALFRHEWIWLKNRGSNFANTVREPMKEHESVLVFSRGKWTYNKQMQERAEGGLNRAKYGFEQRAKNSEAYGKFQIAPKKSLGAMRGPSSWQKFNTAAGHEKTEHPTQKPVALMEYLIRTYSHEGALVLDNCMGSGTTGVACANTGRRFIGIEKDERYFQIARERIEKALKENEDATKS